MMEQETEFDLMNYSELRFQAKQFGVKANLKADKLRKELKRVSMLGSISTKDDDDDEDEMRDSLAPVSFPLKTPAHVTRRKNSRALPQHREHSHAPPGPSSRDDVPVFASGSIDSSKSTVESVILSVADKTLVDPLVEGKVLEDMRPYLTDDEDGADLKSKAADLSAFVSEREEELSSDVASTEHVDFKRSSIRESSVVVPSDVEPKVHPPVGLELERQKTFEKDSSTNIRPPLARQRTFEMESPTIDSSRPPISHRRTFEMESPTAPSLQPLLASRRPFEKASPESSKPLINKGSPTDSSERRRTFEKDPIDGPAPGFNLAGEVMSDRTENASKNGVDEDAVASVFGMEVPDAHDAPPALEFSILEDETSGLTDGELKARIMASIAVTPSTALGLKATSAKNKDSANEDGDRGKSCSKDWKKIHSTNENGMESLVDFYQRKRKLAADAQKSSQKSATKVAEIVAATKKLRAGNSARALAFPKSKVTSLSKPISKSSIATLSDVPERGTRQSRGKATASTNRGPSIGRAKVESSTKSIAALSLKRARTEIASPGAGRNNSKAEKVTNGPTSKRIRATNVQHVPSASASVKDSTNKFESFVPTVFSTKNMSLNFAALGTKPSAPTVQPLVKSGVAVAFWSKAGAKPKNIPSVSKAKVPTSLLPSLPKLSGERRVSPRVNKSDVVTTSDVSAVPPTTVFSNPNAGKPKVTTPLSRLAPSRNTTPGKMSASGTPASASRLLITPQSHQKSPWIPAGVATPKFNFAGTAENTENFFKFTAVGSSTSRQQQTKPQKFDLKESLKQKLKYKPHSGPLRAFDEGKAKASAMNKKQFRR